MAIIALFYSSRRSSGRTYFTLDDLAFLVVNFSAFTGNDNPIALFQISDLLGQRSKRQRIGADVGFSVAVAHDQRRTAPRTDKHIGMIAKRDCQRKRAAQAGKHIGDSFTRSFSVFDPARDQVGNHFAVGVAFQLATVSCQFGLEFLEILDDPIVHQGDLIGGMRMRIFGCRCAVRCPARMCDPDIAGRIIAFQHGYQIGELAFCPAAHERAIVDRANPGTVITAIFHALETIDQPVCHWLIADDPDNSAHRFRSGVKTR